MAIIAEGIMELGTIEVWRRTFAGDVIVLQDGSTIAHGRMDRSGRFCIELPPGTTGDVELRTSLVDSAALTVQVDHRDIDVRILVNRGLGYVY